jgi:hypothetical protein
MRLVTVIVVGDTAFSRGTTTCASCRRQTLTLMRETDRAPEADDGKCAHCSRVIEEDDEVVVVAPDRFHDHCWRRLTTDGTVRSSRALSRRSRELIRQSRSRMGFDTDDLAG